MQLLKEKGIENAAAVLRGYDGLIKALVGVRKALRLFRGLQQSLQ